jgi:hypothetical protein
MPLLVYECKDCGAKAERLRMKREKIGRVPFCHVCMDIREENGKPVMKGKLVKMEKVKFPGHAVQFLGDGWSK